MTDKIKRSLDFVVKFYRPGAFRPDGWFIAPPLPFWRRHAVAIGIIGIALAAMAAVTTYVVVSREDPSPAPAVETTTSPVSSDTVPATNQEIRKVEFNDATLREVVEAIEATYGVRVSGETSGQPRLTLSYQGTAEDLTATINDLLGTNLTVEK
ncbi:MAG: hypothetical protein K2J70_00435 [Muribaculaceae bacterium]|nr:hypothetical protein [Muribaculaceae bacterium]